MVELNVGNLKHPVVILKMVMMVFGILILAFGALYAGSGFERDRFNFITSCGVMIFVWCLVTFLLYLLDVTSRIESGTMRGIEIAGAIFLSLLCAQAAIYGFQTIYTCNQRFNKINVALLTYWPQKLKYPNQPASKDNPYDPVLPHQTMTNVTCIKEFPNTKWNIAERQKTQDDHKSHITTEYNVNAACATCCMITICMLIASAIIVYLRGTPGVVEPAHV